PYGPVRTIRNSRRPTGPTIGPGRHEDAGNVTLPRVSRAPSSRRPRSRDHAFAVCRPMYGKVRTRPLVEASFHAEGSRKSGVRDAPVPGVSRDPDVLGVSWRSQPARTSMRR